MTTGRLVGSWAASVAATLVVVAFALGGMVLLMVVLNGFSERQAKPIFLGYLFIMSVANFAMVALATVLVLKSEPDGGLRKRMAIGNGLAFTSVPTLLALAAMAAF